MKTRRHALPLRREPSRGRPIRRFPPQQSPRGERLWLKRRLTFRSNRSRPAYAWNCDLHSLDTRKAFRAAFLEIDAIRTNHEQRASILAAECAGDYGPWKLHPFADLAALVQASSSLVIGAASQMASSA